VLRFLLTMYTPARHLVRASILIVGLATAASAQIVFTDTEFASLDLGGPTGLSTFETADQLALFPGETLNNVNVTIQGTLSVTFATPVNYAIVGIGNFGPIYAFLPYQFTGGATLDITPVSPALTEGPDGGFDYSPLVFYGNPSGIGYGTGVADGLGDPLTLTIPFEDSFDFDGSLFEEATDFTLSQSGVIVDGDLEDFLWSPLGQLSQQDPLELFTALGLGSPTPTDPNFFPGNAWDPVVTGASVSASALIEYDYNPIDLPTGSVPETPSPLLYLFAALALVGFRVFQGYRAKLLGRNAARRVGGDCLS
jgi:hypothetical protein